MDLRLERFRLFERADRDADVVAVRIGAVELRSAHGADQRVPWSDEANEVGSPDTTRKSLFGTAIPA
jgi:hypothetical protein